jgi:hypothetical protein
MRPRLTDRAMSPPPATGCRRARLARRAERHLAVHRDRVTGVDRVIAALTGGSVFSGGYDAGAPGRIRWNPELKGNVKAFRTDVLVDKAAEELFRTWSKNIEQWNRTGSDRPYHYYGSAIWFTRIGHAMGEAMLELLGLRGHPRGVSFVRIL